MTESSQTEQLPDEIAAAFGRLSAWCGEAALGETGRRADGTLDNNLGALAFADFFAAFCDRLNTWLGPFARISLAFEVLHPELSGGTLYWRDGVVEKSQVMRAQILSFMDYLKSPVYEAEQTNRPWRWRATDPVPDMELIRSLHDQGVSDYILFPLPIQDTNRTTTMSFATRRKGGFAELGGADDGLHLLRRVAWLMTPFAERVALRLIAIDLLDSYVGKVAGSRVYAGQIERGAVEPIDAAILVADLRGFTRLSEELGESATVGLLNGYFDTLGDAVEETGGQILKFMGDGLLAVFPLEDGDRRSACIRALGAAQQARRNLATLNRERGEDGKPAIDFGIGLHVGTVAFGNIGSRTRLDFTVIGPAVNEASRIQDLTKELREPILASGSFAAAAGSGLYPVATRAIRGVAQPVELFAPN
ncbi:adenylate cyclase [Dongia mobilis]|uniref:Adenylate cyclase n=1 Tax=Dongia mobilis TaxID=578943 RepID=A0A4R6WW57_9PROT|nr:adenylate/guanylate cyclase domain-containing protein [Dongia mobilis]TDQ85515.1 adenylate cyclase [Dongia mobilis]